MTEAVLMLIRKQCFCYSRQTPWRKLLLSLPPASVRKMRWLSVEAVSKHLLPQQTRAQLRNSRSLDLQGFCPAPETVQLMKMLKTPKNKTLYKMPVR